MKTIVGTWSLVEAWDVPNASDPARRVHPWGDPPSGYWTFDPAGHFSLMIVRHPPLPIPSGGANWLNGEVPEALWTESFSTSRPYAYFGRYRVEHDAADSERGVIVMDVAADVLRAYTGTTQRRKFRFDGADHLDVGESGTYQRRLRRLSSFASPAEVSALRR